MKLQIGVVKFGSTLNSSYIHRILLHWFPKSTIYILNNRPGDAKEGEIQGSNVGHEFSGYLELLMKMNETAPILLVNDTLFKNHFTTGWLHLVDKMMNRWNHQPSYIFGDARYDGIGLTERPNPFFASWIFLFQVGLAKESIIQSLTDLLNTPSPRWSQEYEIFLNTWLNDTKWYKGWHKQLANPEALFEKKRNIYWEHQLSAKLLNYEDLSMRSFGEIQPFLYFGLRITDRFYTAIYRFMGLIRWR